MSLSGSIFAAFAVGFATSALILRLTRQKGREVLAEHAGKEMAKAVDKAAHQIEKAPRKIQRAAKDATK